MATVLVIDAGTSETKALVIGDDGRIYARTSQKISTRTIGAAGREQDPREIWRSVEQTATAALAASGRPVDVVALATQGESVLAFDPSTGAPLTPLITWQDRRAEPICRELSGHTEELVRVTGLRLSSYFSAPKMRWIRENLTREGMVATIDAWLLLKLTGRVATDSATASRSLVVDLETGRWDPRLLNVFGLDDEQLPQIVASDEIVGDTGLFGAPLPVAGVILDQPAALLAQGCLGPGQAKVTIGTGAFHLCNIGATVPAGPLPLTFSTAWEVGGVRTLCTDGQVYAAGSAVAWLVEQGLIPVATELDAHCYARGPGQLVFVPGFDAPGGPRWIGREHGDTQARQVAAVVYGIAAQIADLVELSGSDDEVLRVDGGLTRSRALMRAVADLTQMKMAVYPEAEATAQGAAALARLAVELGPTRTLEIPAVDDPTIYLPGWLPQQAHGYRRLYRDTLERESAQGEAAR